MQLSGLGTGVPVTASRARGRTLPRRAGAASLLLALLLFLLSGAGPARAEDMPLNPSGEVAFRGNYWRDRNTRVLNPTVDLRQELPSGVGLQARYMLDAITSASVAAGASSDRPFTELRHESGFGVEVPVGGKNRLSGSYSYSTESDYWSHNAGLRAKLSFFQDNTSLLLGVDYGHNTVGKRLGPTGYLVQGTMQTVHAVVLATQALSRTVLGTASYELTYADGYMNNPYRPVWVNSERREVEKLPTTRLRHVVALSLHGMLRTGNPTVSHVTLRPGLRIHADSWALKAVNPELAGYVQLGPVEVRGLLGYYRQWAVSFYRSECSVAMGGFPGAPCYSDYGAEWGTRTDPTSGAVGPDYVYTSDVKLGDYATYTWDLQIKWRLSFLAGSGFVGDRLSRSAVELSGGMWFADRAVGNQFGIPLSSGDPSAPAGCSLTCGAGFAALGWYVPL